MSRLDEINEQINALQAEARGISNVAEAISIEKKKAEFKQIKGKIFYAELHGFGDQNYVNAYRVVSCSDWGVYNMCNVILVMLMYNGNDFVSLTCKEDTLRVDNLYPFNNKYKEMDEMVEKGFKFIIESEMKKVLSKVGLM